MQDDNLSNNNQFNPNFEQSPNQPLPNQFNPMLPGFGKKKSDKFMIITAIFGGILALGILILTIVNGGNFIKPNDKEEKTEQAVELKDFEDLTKEDVIAWVEKSATDANGTIKYPEGLFPEGISGKPILLSSYDSADDLDEIIKDSYVFYDRDNNSPVSDLKINKSYNHFITFSSDSYSNNAAIGRTMFGISFDRKYFDFSYSSGSDIPTIHSDDLEFIRTVLAALLLSSFSKTNNVYNYKFEKLDNEYRLTLYCVEVNIYDSTLLLYEEHMAMDRNTKELIIDDYYNHDNDTERVFELSEKEIEKLRNLLDSTILMVDPD